MPSETLTIIFGAGASFDCADGNNSQLRGGYRPPLVKDLFAFRPEFNDILSKYRRAETLSDDIRDKLGRGISIESILKGYSQKNPLIRRKQYWEVPLFLQELLGEVSRRYVINGVTRFETLINAVIDSPYQRVMFVTVNYDLFLERALERITGVIFEDLRAYFPPSQKWSLVKLHGSVTWGKQLLNQPQGPISRIDLFSALNEEPILSPKSKFLQDMMTSKDSARGGSSIRRCRYPWKENPSSHVLRSTSNKPSLSLQIVWIS